MIGVRPALDNFGLVLKPHRLALMRSKVSIKNKQRKNMEKSNWQNHCPALQSPVLAK